MTDTRRPTPANLEQLRRLLRADARKAGRPIPSSATPDGRAEPHELEHGIGWPGAGHGHQAEHAMARRGANRMRREAWTRVPEHMRRDRYAVANAEPARFAGYHDSSEAHERYMAAWTEHQELHR